MTFENIFSKTKTSVKIDECPNPKLPIIIDTREKQSLISANLVGKKANISFEKLEIGDYLVGETIIERKTYSDFISSILDKRLLEQLSNMKKYPKYLLILENFDFDYKKFGIHENVIRGVLLSIAVDFQIPLVYTKNESDTASFLISLAKKFSKPKTEYSLRQSKKASTLAEQKQFILEGFPGVGPVASKNLLEKFTTIKNIINAPEEELEKILGKKTSKFKETLEK